MGLEGCKAGFHCRSRTEAFDPKTTYYEEGRNEGELASRTAAVAR